MNTEKTEAMKLESFHAHQARLVRLWLAAGLGVPNEYEGNLVHYAMCEVIDRTELWDLPQRFIGFDTSRPDLVLMSQGGATDENGCITQGYATPEERDLHDEMAEYYVDVRCCQCKTINYITV